MKRMLLILFVLTFATVIARAADKTIVGVVTKADANKIEIRTDDRKVITVTVNATTTYRKWINSKPLQQDPAAHSSDVKVGTRVHVDVTKGDPQTAGTIWIVTR